jgi:HNH endonuclease.
MSKKGEKWLRRKATIRRSATLDGRRLADEFAAEGRALGYTVDHIIPLSKGGKHHRGNLQWLSHADNVAKGDSLDWHHPSGIDCVPYKWW